MTLELRGVSKIEGGQTPKAYRQPVNTTTAQVFSEPPMEFLQIAKAGGQLMFGKGQGTTASGKLEELPDGRYMAGFRPNYLKSLQPSDTTVRFTTDLLVTELTGSETFVQLDPHQRCTQNDPWENVSDLYSGH